MICPYFLRSLRAIWAYSKYLIIYNVLVAPLLFDKQGLLNDILEVLNNISKAVDSIQGVYDTLKNAAKESAENNGRISVDKFQSIISLGAEYIQHLEDENGLLSINEENINNVIAAKTNQLVLDSAMTYVERLKLKRSYQAIITTTLAR